MHPKKRIQSYDIHDLGEELKQPGFVTITDAMINRVNYNSARGKKTHIIVDEFHIAYVDDRIDILANFAQILYEADMHTAYTYILFHSFLSGHDNTP